MIEDRFWKRRSYSSTKSSFADAEAELLQTELEQNPMNPVTTETEEGRTSAPVNMNPLTERTGITTKVSNERTCIEDGGNGIYGDIDAEYESERMRIKVSTLVCSQTIVSDKSTISECMKYQKMYMRKRAFKSM